MNRDKLFHLREHYEKGELLEHEVSEDPYILFKQWMSDALEDKLFEPNAMSLATVDMSGQPSCRTLLLKDIMEGQFVFYTNYESKKGRQLEENSKAAILFWWREHERQVRIEGIVKKVDWQTSNEYYQTRPTGSQIGAKASPQSKVVKDRAELNELYRSAEKEFLNGDNQCPYNWGGYALKPNLFEFWQGRPNRLHDRLEFKFSHNVWQMVRLAP